jgi:ribosomal protein S18 acetylase RimI-like enzyme
MMEIRNLSGISFATIYQTFLDAFKDYAVDVNYMDAVKLENRAIKNGYDPTFSAGAFLNDKLIGFTLVGIDREYIRPSAFDIMTGLIKEYRGKGLAGKMFEHIRNELIKSDFEQFYLEVLQENSAAVKAYQKEGFGIVRKFNCYELAVEDFEAVLKLHIPLTFKEIDKDHISDFETFADWLPSWENSFGAVRRIPDEVIIISACYSIKKVGLIIYYPALKWIMNILVDPVYRNMGVGTALLEKLLAKVVDKQDKIRFLNIPDTDYALNEFLERSGFKLLTKQYEMVLELN